MMSGNGQGQASGKEPVERMLDLFVHTPIGLAVMAWKRVPEMVTAVPDFVGQAVAKGCASLAGAEERISEEVRKARMIGQVAVTFGGRQLRKEVDARLRDARQAAEGVVVSFIPGMEVPGQSNGSRTASASGERGAPFVTATETPTAPASAAGTTAEPAPARRAAAKPTGARKAPVKTTAKAPAKTNAKTTAKTTAKAPAKTTAKTPAKTTAKAPAQRASNAPASAAGLPIREYDGLSASQVVSRLTGLSPEELRAVQAYEENSRGRRTVLLAIDRLLS
jgi:outer membrane biosynthesis protein TonB